MPQLPAPKYVVKVTVDAIFDQSMGPTAAGRSPREERMPADPARSMENTVDDPSVKR